MTSVSVISALLISHPRAPRFSITLAGARKPSSAVPTTGVVQGQAQRELRQTVAVFGGQSLQLIHRSEVKQARARGHRYRQSAANRCSSAEAANRKPS